MNFFEPIEREIQLFKDFFENECPVFPDETFESEIMSKDQIRYLIHFKKELLKDKNKTDRCKAMKGARKHRIWGMYYMLGSMLSSRYKGMVEEIAEHCDEVPEECRIPFLLSVCMQNNFGLVKLNERLMEMLRPLENRNLSEEILQHEYITVYTPAFYDQSPKLMKHHLVWFVNIEDAVLELLGYYDRAERRKMKPTVLPVNIMEAQIAVKDILLLSNVYCTTGYHIIIQDDCVRDIGIIDHLDDLQEKIFLKQMKLRKRPDETEDTYIIRRFDELREAEEKAGIPSIRVSFANINLRLTKMEDVRTILQSKMRLIDGEAVRITRELISENPDNGWMMTFMNTFVKDGYYKAVWLDHYERCFFVAYAARRKKLKGYEGPYGTQRGGPSSLDRYEIVAIDPDTYGKTLSEAINGRKKVEDSVVATSKKEQQHTKNETAVTVSQEDIQTLKKQMYIQQLEEMYENELEKMNAELESLNEKMKQMHVEMQSMEKMLAGARKKLSDQDGISILKAGNEVEKFDHEAKAFVLKAIRHEAEHSETGTRRKDVLMDVLKANSDGTENLLEQKSEEIKRIVKGYRLSTEITDKLQAYGFEMIKDGGHTKMRYPKDSRYTQTFASTPSDYRAGENLATQIRKTFF